MTYSRWILFICFILISGCTFHLQGAKKLPPPMQRLYLQTTDPYGYLARNLKQYFKVSNITLVANQADADSSLVILQDDTSQDLISVSSTQQTRQYNIKVTVAYEILGKNGVVLLPTETMSQIQPITVQSDQILGTSNIATMYTQQLHRQIAYAMMNRFASIDVANNMNAILHPAPIKNKKKLQSS